MKKSLVRAVLVVASLPTAASAQCLNRSNEFGPASGGLGMNARMHDFAVHNGILPSSPP